MKKNTLIAIISVVIVLLIVVIVALVMGNSKPKTNLESINNVEELSKLVDKLYEGENVFSSLETYNLDLSDTDRVKSATGLENGNNFEYVVVSEPMITSQAYSLVLAKVKNGVNASDVAKQMSENVNTAKWICVSAEKLYATSSGDIVCLVMSSEDMAKPIFEKFKELAGNVGQVYEITETIDLPPEMLAQ